MHGLLHAHILPLSTYVTPIGQLSDNRCPLLPDPADGSITCSLTRNDAPTDGESCSITCDSGFDLSGSSSRTCQIQSGRGSWTGTGATCRGMCSGTVSIILAIA